MNRDQLDATGSFVSVERLIAWGLRAGVWGSSTLLGLGIVATWFFPLHAREPFSLRQVFSPLDALSLLYAGTLLMILTPFFRVLLAAIGFAREHDRRFVGVSVFVFCMLICGAVVAFVRTP
jgi:uncharacterized membrane protein